MTGMEKGREHPEVGGVAGGEDRRHLDATEGGELGLQHRMQRRGTCDQTSPGRSGAPLPADNDCRGDHPAAPWWSWPVASGPYGYT